MVVGDFPVETDLAVVGGGPAGNAAALRAAQLGVHTTLIEPSSRPGGAWIRDGGLVTHQIAALGAAANAARRAADAGVSFGGPAIDLARLRAYLERQAADVTDGMRRRLESAGVTIVQGTARFENARRLTAQGDQGFARVRFRRAIVATGGRFESHPDRPDDCPCISDVAGLLRRDDVPSTLLVYGGGASAVELAMNWAFLGSAVTLITPDECVLGRFDPHLREPVIERMSETLECMHLGCSIQSMSCDERGAHVQVDGAADLRPTFDHVVLAARRVPAFESLDLGTTGVTLDTDGWIEVDHGMATSDPRIFAAGDCTGPPFVATRAIMQGRIAAERVAGWQSSFDVRAIPIAVHTEPQIASCGEDERSLTAAGLPFRVYAAQNDETRSRILADPDTGLVLGAAIVGPHACEAIGEAVLAIEMGAVVEDLAGTLHAQSTAQSLGEAARS